MAKKSSKPSGKSSYACPACQNELKPTLGTITGVSPQKCKCGKFMVIPIWLSALALGLIFALWYGFFLLLGYILPLIVQIFLLPLWLYYGYRISRLLMFKLVTARELK